MEPSQLNQSDSSAGNSSDTAFIATSSKQKKFSDVFEPTKETSLNDGASVLNTSELLSSRLIDKKKLVEMEGQAMPSMRRADDGVNRWMAFPPEQEEQRYESTTSLQKVVMNGRQGTEKMDDKLFGHDITQNEEEGQIVSEAGMAERAAEWGLVIKTDKTLGVGNRTSRDETRVSSERGSGTKTSSGESSRGEDYLPNVPKELNDALSMLQQTFVVSDATRQECPIMYASAGFFKMTGYSPKEVIGKNCRFLQGPDTDQEEVSKLRGALKMERSYCGRLVNYKKDGTPFWNLLTITPIKDDSGKVIKYIGMQVEVSKFTEGFSEKLLRPNGLPKSLIRYDAREKEKAISSITEVVQTVQHPEAFLQPQPHEAVIKSEEHIQNYDGSPVLEIGNAKNSITLPSPKNVTFSMSHRSRSSVRNSKLLDRISMKGSRRWSSSLVVQFDSQTLKEPEILMTKVAEHTESWDHLERQRDIRQGIDLATTLERIEKNFVITDPRLPDNPIIYASDSFLELTEYTREEILGRNCRFLQGPETDQEAVSKIRDAIRDQQEVTVQLINYSKSGRKFWNLFHLQPMRDQKGILQYFIGVQLDGSDHVEPLLNCLSKTTEIESAKLVKATAENVDEAVRELPDANLTPEDLWAIHSRPVFPRPHNRNSASWRAIKKVSERGGRIGLEHFKPVRPLGCGDTGSVHLVELKESGELFAMKAMEKSAMLNRNKVHRVCTEREIISLLDHPFLPTLYASFQTATHVCFVTDFCPGGEFFALLDKQPMKALKEDASRFYTAEVVIGLEYLHCLGVIYRDLKPENILLQKEGHIVLTDFDLSFLATSRPQVIKHTSVSKRRKSRSEPPPTFFAEPSAQSNSFVGTEEYIAPEIITGAGHSGAIDWWALGILLYEMLYGRTPFRGKNRQKTFTNILHKDLTFPSSIPVSLEARQLINQLLQRDPTNRLGSKTGANEVKQHPFFRGINWPLIRDMSPPILDVPMETTGKELDPYAVTSWVDQNDDDPVQFSNLF